MINFFPKLIPKELRNCVFWYFPKWVCMCVYRNSINCHFPHSRGEKEIALTTKTHYTLIRNVMLFSLIYAFSCAFSLSYFSTLRFVCLPVCVCLCVSVYVGKYEKSVLLLITKRIKIIGFDSVSVLLQAPTQNKN